ncbi:MAG: KpsF/GutQ family sugar-phosphate isomerase [Myxococcaceae bacterium]|nr:KpsF/GutQ family sugar-phosphate isomerase [Myxococcaceae bacterium]
MARPPRRSTAKAQLAWARTVLAAEARAITSLSGRLDATFLAAVEALHACTGRIITTGIGKPGFIAQKLSATLASTGVPSLYLHPAEAAHGDLGRVVSGDVVVALSNSGTTEEILRLLVPLKRQRVTIVALTSDPRSPLAKGSDVVLDIGAIDEACPIGLVPTASSAALHALCDALAMTLAWRRELTPDRYALFHPGGKLGRSVLKVREVMRSGEANPLVQASARLSDALVVMTNTSGRPGATNVVDAKGRLVGIFTDGDFRRLAERGPLALDAAVSTVMAKRPRTIGPDELVLSAAAIMRETKVDQLPVVDARGRPVGLVDVQDVLAARVV